MSVRKKRDDRSEEGRAGTPGGRDGRAARGSDELTVFVKLQHMHGWKMRGSVGVLSKPL